jgi:hypothetical protein
MEKLRIERSGYFAPPHQPHMNNALLDSDNNRAMKRITNECQYQYQ